MKNEAIELLQRRLTDACYDLELMAATLKYANFNKNLDDVERLSVRIRDEAIMVLTTLKKIQNGEEHNFQLDAGQKTAQIEIRFDS